MLGRPFGRHRIVERDAICTSGRMKAHIALPPFAGEGDNRDTRMARFDRLGDLARGFHSIAGKRLALERTRPAIENLDHLCPGHDLHGQVFDGCVRDPVDQGVKRLWGFHAHFVRGRLVRGAAPGDHVGGHSPRRARKADQGRFRRQFARQDAHSFINRCERFVDRVRGFQRRNAAHIGDRGQARPFAGGKPQIRAQRLRHEQNVGKQDRRVKTVAANRLQGNFGGQIRRVA